VSAELAGPAAILDGDTIRIGETRIRLVGIDAPETDQKCLDRTGKLWLCGIAARDAMAAVVA
jgi:endonuclease YncB( thermonuclease family)